MGTSELEPTLCPFCHLNQPLKPLIKWIDTAWRDKAWSIAKLLVSPFKLLPDYPRHLVNVKESSDLSALRPSGRLCSVRNLLKMVECSFANG
jgi:hypothetical protein